MIRSILQSVAVIGAGGTMGRGVALCVLRIMSRQRSIGTLILVDSSTDRLAGCRTYLSVQLNKTMPAPQVTEILADIQFDTRLDSASGAGVVFEVVVESMTVKTEVLSRLNTLCSQDTLFLSNTSSIPIHMLESAAHITGRLMGFHFYNPPAVQPLIELIPSQYTPDSLVQFSYALSKEMEKIVVESRDVAGFIGNGYFIRECMFAFSKIRELLSYGSFQDSVDIVNCVTRDILLRPMGICQLMEYVGTDVVTMIAQIMDQCINDEDISVADDIDKLKNETVKKEVYTSVARHYIGPLPEMHMEWQTLRHRPDKDVYLKSYFKQLRTHDTPGVQMAIEFLNETNRISHHLVQTDVAKSLHDVDQVLRLGFHHLYGGGDAV